MIQTNGSQLYAGCHLFKPLSDYLEQPLDQLNLLIAQSFCLVMALLFRTVLSHRKVSSTIRHWTSLTIGVVVGYFFIGREIYHLFLLTTVSYIAILVCNPRIVQMVVLFVALSHLSYLHLLRLLSTDWSLDITAPLMIAVQRVTNVAFSLNDGLTETEEQLTEEQKRFVIRRKPSLLEFFSYLFQFPTLICGPLVFYNDYIEFISGHNFERHLKRNDELPSPLRIVVKKLLSCILFCSLFCATQPIYPVTQFRDPQFLYETSFLWKMWFILCHTTITRFKYYFAFILGELLCIASGLGFDGFTSDGEPIWDLMENVDVFRFENALNLRTAFESWNKKTQIWLRRTAYDRNRRFKLLFTYLLSSIWHGLFPGYYLTSFSFAFFTLSSRSVRHSLRHRFKEKGKAMAFIYDCITFIATKVIMAYMVFPFNVLEFWASIQVYKQLYFFGHILGLVAIFIVPRLWPPRSRQMKNHQD